MYLNMLQYINTAMALIDSFYIQEAYDYLEDLEQIWQKIDLKVDEFTNTDPQNASEILRLTRELYLLLYDAQWYITFFSKLGTTILRHYPKQEYLQEQ